MTDEDAVREVADQLQKYKLQLPRKGYTYTELLQDLALHINFLITNDFHFLISVLYYLDIPEKKLKELLTQSGTTTAGDIIAKMMIERQLQKIASREILRDNTNISDDEKW